jgi:hypothetical protein
MGDVRRFRRLVKTTFLFGALIAVVSNGISETAIVFPHLIDSSHGFALSNPLPVDIVGLVINRDISGRILSGESLVVPSEGALDLRTAGVGAAGKLEKLEIAHLGVPRNALPDCDSSAGELPELSNEKISHELTRFDFSSTIEAKAMIRRVEEIAALEREQRIDHFVTIQDDAYKKERNRQAENSYQELAMTYAAAGLPYVDFEHLTRLANERGDTYSKLIISLSSLADELSAKEAAKRQILKDEIDAMLPVLSDLKVKLTEIQNLIQDRSREVNFGAAFSTKLYDAIESKKEGSPEYFDLLSSPIRLCDGFVVEDYIRIEIRSSGTSQAFLAQVEFDGGKSQKTVFRHVKGTQSWVARLFWPNDVSVAKVKVRSVSGGVWKAAPGSIGINATSPLKAKRSLENAVRRIQKEYDSKKSRTLGNTIESVNPVF